MLAGPRQEIHLVDTRIWGRASTVPGARASRVERQVTGQRHSYPKPRGTVNAEAAGLANSTEQPSALRRQTRPARSSSAMGAGAPPVCKTVGMSAAVRRSSNAITPPGLAETAWGSSGGPVLRLNELRPAASRVDMIRECYKLRDRSTRATYGGISTHPPRQRGDRRRRRLA